MPLPITRAYLFYAQGFVYLLKRSPTENTPVERAYWIATVL